MTLKFPAGSTQKWPWDISAEMSSHIFGEKRIADPEIGSLPELFNALGRGSVISGCLGGIPECLKVSPERIPERKGKAGLLEWRPLRS